MRRTARLLPLLVWLAVGLAPAQESEPLDVDQVEDVQVRLVLIDVLVIDKQGRTVPDLTVDDFEILADGRPIDVDTLDVACPGGQADDVKGVRHAEKRPVAVVPDAERKIVLAVDYLHTSRQQRAQGG